MPKKEVTKQDKENIRRKVEREFPLSKCLQEIHFYRYVREIEEQTMTTEEIINEINEKVRYFKEKMNQHT
jgi:hypothetical protein